MELGRRIDVLDYLRGFALLGIVLVNIGPLLEAQVPASGSVDAVYWRFLYLFVEGRFYSIFTFLFGVGFYLFITRANQKGKNGYVLFFRRIVVLFIFGLVHVRFHPGEALTVYAISGLILLPFYKFNRSINLTFSILMLMVIGYYSIKLFMVVPLMLLGMTAGQYQVFERLEEHKKKIAIFTGISFLLSVVGIIYQYQFAPTTFGTGSALEYEKTRQFINLGITIGPIVSGFYVGSMILLLQFTTIQKILAPLKNLGRMALTNYLAQTAFIFISKWLLNAPITYTQTLFVCLGIYVIQLVFSTIWLRYFRFGPFEWMWRMVTYLKRMPIKS
ncbi:DUF418 domain-containing protein [Bacillus sp. JJ1764]|uniref:DUF418 domain-containing protein n=1 Tax=Bacillus sp. JJ1764 TaxID=3122964 RepID=UPI002FFE747B